MAPTPAGILRNVNKPSEENVYTPTEMEIENDTKKKCIKDRYFLTNCFMLSETLNFASSTDEAIDEITKSSCFVGDTTQRRIFAYILDKKSPYYGMCLDGIIYRNYISTHLVGFKIEFWIVPFKKIDHTSTCSIL